MNTLTKHWHKNSLTDPLTPHHPHSKQLSTNKPPIFHRRSNTNAPMHTYSSPFCQELPTSARPYTIASKRVKNRLTSHDVAFPPPRSVAVFFFGSGKCRSLLFFFSVCATIDKAGIVSLHGGKKARPAEWHTWWACRDVYFRLHIIGWWSTRDGGGRF